MRSGKAVCNRRDRQGRSGGFASFAVLALLSIASSAQAAGEEWAHYGHDAGGMRFSPLKQIDRGNVSGLEVAWTFHTGDIADGASGPRSGFETTPLLIDGRLYLTTPFNRVIALEPTTGRQLWSHDPGIDRSGRYGDGLINRGLAAWRDPSGKAGQACGLRLYEATLEARLIALDARSGQPCEGFGRAGEVSLRDVPGFAPGPYHMTSPPVVIDDAVVVGSAIDDNSRVDMPSGVVRAYDARTGQLKWSWQPLVSAPGQKTGAANAWSLMAADPERHLVFVPTGSASPDYYGGLRPGDNRWADSVVALDSRTGKLVWGFQLVHHDLWDYDTSPPLLTTLTREGKAVPVVVVGNKTGLLYVLDRETGQPVFPVEERPVPQSDTPGEATSPTQPYSVGLPALARQSIAPGEMFGLAAADKAACEALLARSTGASLFSPPSTKGVIAIPGNVGGSNWSGFAFDPGRSLLIANVNNLPYWVRLIPQAELPAIRREPRTEYARQAGAPYAMSRSPLFSPAGSPCAPPPWGELVAVDLAKGEVRWRTPLGTMSELDPNLAPVRGSGSVNLGGAIVTAGGLAFIGGTIDRSFRAFDIDTGRELWSADVPASAQATPMTFEAEGRQYVVIATGGSAKITEERQGDALVAFALPRAQRR